MKQLERQQERPVFLDLRITKNVNLFFETSAMEFAAKTNLQKDHFCDLS